ncbi:MAG: quinone-dependent dihydroorotate dehydrogenase [Saprospiraceae bacterium]
MYQLLKPLLFSLDAERAHHLTMQSFRATQLGGPITKALTSRWRIEDSRLEKTVFGLKFKNPVGLAAGFDKDGVYYPLMAKLGFGYVELGTVTPRPQVGNPKPRLFRLPKDRALINRMGFNNAGVDALADNIERHGRPSGMILGGNIGKNKDTPNADATSDYLICLNRLHSFVDYFAVNVSSPNTPGLRSLQAKEPLTRLLSELQERNAGFPTSRPILLKIAPDLSEGELDDIVAIAQETKLAGLITTNTTIAREPLTTDPSIVKEIGNGGLSGAPVLQKSTEVLAYLRKNLPANFPLIGVGGITDGASALQKVEAGADLVQVYSGMVYAGPTLPAQINRAIITSMG